ncbi:MAG: hypothetical protein EA396_03465 [Anaerolineaceae bacterium]|nr:MAG: hypothetical protein EA396_03465 [Anaerolineaceae bacterium]
MATNRLIRALCLLIPALTLAFYLGTSIQISGGDVVMPLDDVYIHFQYARGIAEGTPYVYNAGSPPSSGATSFLYPFVLAGGYLVGFRGLALGIWALIVGAVMLGISLRVLIALWRDAGIPAGWAILGGVLFATHGAMAWHFHSGMETGVIITLTLTTFAALWFGDIRAIALSAGALALMRPEGSIMALIVVGIYAVKLWRAKDRRGDWRWLAVPLLAVMTQPAVNALITGSLSASGNQAKSILGAVPFSARIAFERIADNLGQMWLGFAVDTQFIVPALSLLAVIGWLWLVRARPALALIVLGWFVAVSGAIATLDTAFWHFKRYQMPLYALIYPLAGLGGWALWRGLMRWHGNRYVLWPRYLLAASVALTILMTAHSAAEFLRLYRVNVGNVVAQPLPMARWLNEHTDPSAVIAVHDVGMMRYVGERQTLDMVGLTTTGAADYWRHGPGAVGQFLLRERPDYIAAYTTARGLNYLVETPLYGERLAGFYAEYDPADNVALGAEFQGIYRVDWATLDSDRRDQPGQASITPRIARIIAEIDVADLASEADAGYTWRTSPDLPGFMTEFYTLDYIACDTPPCRVTDGGRRINEAESFRFELPPDAHGRDLILITRLHPVERGRLHIAVDGQPLATRHIIQQSGQWLEVATRIPPTNSATLTIDITPEGGVYMPYHHWLVIAAPPEQDDSPARAIFQDGGFDLLTAEAMIENGHLRVDTAWRAGADIRGDYKLFVHLYDEIDAPPVAQMDGYLGAGTLPPANWLDGVISGQIMVDLEGVARGRYIVGIGFYDPFTFERVAIQSDVWAVDADRLLIGEIEIE